MQMRSLTEASVAHTRVLLRTSLNVPISAEGEVGDKYRLQRGLPTIQWLTNQGAKVVLVGYLGRDGASLRPVAKALQQLSPNTPIAFTDTPLEQVGKEVDALAPGSCLMLENVRRYEGEEKNDPTFAASLASLADIFVDDAFAEAHRAYASNVGVAALLPSYAGLLMQEEVTKLSEALEPQEEAIAIVGGAKFETKEPLLERLLGIYKEVFLGGALANDLLKARGFPIGASMTSDMPVPVSLAGEERLHAPKDLTVEGGEARQANTADVRAQERIVDVGERTKHLWAEAIAKSSFVLWNGPLGMYEKGYVDGTDALAEAIAASKCKAVLGGGDTAAALAKFSFDEQRVFVSTGGGAMLQFLTNGGVLPALEVLKR